MLEQFIDNFLHNLFKPLLLFFYLGFLVPLLKVPFEFPYAIYKGLIIYLLISIGWHGGEELASLSAADLGRASGFMALGFFTNLLIGIAAYCVLRFTNIRQIDAAAVAGYYGSDSAGTFVTCLGVLTASNIAYAAYMPVMLAVMEIPGCLVALALVARMRATGLMDALGNMPGEPAYDPSAKRLEGNGQIDELDELDESKKAARATAPGPVRSVEPSGSRKNVKAPGIFSKGVLHEVFLNSVFIVRRDCDRIHFRTTRSEGDVCQRCILRSIIPGDSMSLSDRDGHDGMQAPPRSPNCGVEVYPIRVLGSECLRHLRYADGAPV